MKNLILILFVIPFMFNRTIAQTSPCANDIIRTDPKEISTTKNTEWPGMTNNNFNWMDYNTKLLPHWNLAMGSINMYNPYFQDDKYLRHLPNLYGYLPTTQPSCCLKWNNNKN